MGAALAKPAGAIMRRVQPQAPLHAAVAAFLAANAAAFTTPGHGRGELADAFLRHDVPLAGGADDLRLSDGLLDRAQRLAAAAWRADYCRFLVNGSTQGNQAMLLALAPGSRVVVSRAAHRSVMAGLVLADLDPVWLRPTRNAATGLPGPVAAKDVAAALATAPDAQAVVLTEPSYVGVLSDVTAISSVCRAHGTLLLIDSAWGAHLGFHPQLPPTPLTSGADAMVVSTHKTLPAFTQSALLLARSGGLDPELLGRSLDLLETTSPSAAIYASIDRARWMMEHNGPSLLDRTLRQARRVRAALADVAGVSLVDSDDQTKIAIVISGAGADGFAVERDLEAAGVRVEMLDRDTIIPLLHVGTSDAWVSRLCEVLPAAIQRHRGRPRPAQVSAAFQVAPEQACRPRAAFWAARRRVRADAADGLIAAEAVTPYPPGIPAIAPGERISGDVVRLLRAEHAAGSRLAYCSDPTLETILVLA